MVVRKIDSCCCFTLQTATLIIGILWMLNYLCFYGVLIFNHDVCRVLTSLCFDKTDLGMIWKLSYNALGSVLIPLLIYGSMKEDHKLMSPFIIFEAIRLVVETFIFGFWTVRLIVDDFTNGVFFLIIGMILINILGYFWIVLYNRKQEIKSFNPPSYSKSTKPYEVNC